MNNDRNRNEKLLAELFHDDWSAGPAAAFARRAAAHARGRHRLRSLAAAGTTAAFALLFAFALTRRPAPTPTLSPPVKSVAAYEIISDAEMLAQLRDQPLLVVQKPDGAKEFVLLGH